MKNSNVVLSIEDTWKLVLKFLPEECAIIQYDKKGEAWLTGPVRGLTRDEAVKAARAILEYYDEY